ncbi:MAG: hypothetical protein AABX19_04690 [Nanoarchaeota archaeon]
MAYWMRYLFYLIPGYRETYSYRGGDLRIYVAWKNQLLNEINSIENKKQRINSSELLQDFDYEKIVLKKWSESIKILDKKEIEYLNTKFKQELIEIDSELHNSNKRSLLKNILNEDLVNNIRYSLEIIASQIPSLQERLNSEVKSR